VGRYTSTVSSSLVKICTLWLNSCSAAQFRVPDGEHRGGGGRRAVRQRLRAGTVPLHRHPAGGQEEGGEQDWRHDALPQHRQPRRQPGTATD
jgi:hypothetical protein